VAILVAPIAWFFLAWLTPPAPLNLSWPPSNMGRFIMLLFIYPVLEELVFRGWIQGEVRRFRWGTAIFATITSANIITSSIFTASHFLMHPPLAAISVMIPSLIFGHFRDRYNASPYQRLAAPIGLHIWYNSGYFLLFY
jgi:membrane protease YdiL (CAAX protease family)